MIEITLNITTLSPLAVSRRKPGAVSEAEDHIPGSVIRGAIAGQILQQSGQLSTNFLHAEFGDEFQTLFVSEQPAIFQNAYPAVAKVEQQLNPNKEKSESISQIVSEKIHILPATSVSSKTNPGFKPKGNGVFDTLIDRFCADAYNYPYDPSCPKDKGRVEPYSGFYSCNSDNKYYSHSVDTRFLTRVGINRRRATSEEDILYSIQVLNESFLDSPKQKNWHNYVYISAILVENTELAQKLVDFINVNHQNFRLGGATSRGLGKVDITATINNTSSDLETRFNKFNEKLKERWQLWSVFSEKEFPAERSFFTIDLQADAILTENWCRTTVISPAMLCQFVGLETEFSQLDQEQDDFIKLEVAYSSHDYRSGWNSAWGLMKDVELVTNRGGVYLFSTNANKKTLWIDKLKQLELNGVGERTCEGFGQIYICNPFHLVTRETAK
ncbi:MAG: CRISPR-associated RAMP protein Csx10 [Calothrix sp. C42_A2020_038]|nr:CRISPR-associated RAMP protein Csx10 [Calothrix sp. C42_A2020_038]